MIMNDTDPCGGNDHDNELSVIIDIHDLTRLNKIGF